MSDTAKSPGSLLEGLAALDAAQRREVAEALRKISDTFADLPDGRYTAHTLGFVGPPARSALNPAFWLFRKSCTSPERKALHEKNVLNEVVAINAVATLRGVAGGK